MSTPSSSIGLSNISTQQEASRLPGEGGREACLFEDALKHDREDGGGLCMRVDAQCVGVCLWMCATLFRWRAHVFHVTEYASSKTGRQAPCEPLDYIRVLQIDCKRVVVSTGKCC